MEYIANKELKLAGVDYHKGDKVDVSGLADHKISQLLNQRRIVPLIVTSDTPTPASA